jgi:AraC-like DNA-binding protein
MALLFYADGKTEHITADYEIPHTMRQLLLPSASAVYCSFEGGSQLIQKLRDGPNTLYLRNFFINRKTTLFPFCTKDSLTLIYVLEGKIHWSFDCGETMILKEGYSYLLRIAPGVRHQAIFEPASYTLVHFDVFQSPPKEIASEDPLRPAAVRMSLATYGLLHDLERPGLAHAPPDFGLGEKISLLISYYLKARDEPLKKERASLSNAATRLISAKELIDKNEGKRLNIHEIARRCFINKEQLKKGFLEMFGKPVNKYQTWVRMQRGRQLLITTNSSVHHISIDVGYDDPSSFADMFRKTFGTTPSKFRESFRETGGQPRDRSISPA